MISELYSLLNGQNFGRVYRAESGRIHFSYDARGRTNSNAQPLSISMPLALETHGDSIIPAILSGLLPDIEVILDNRARKFQVSARNCFSSMSHFGEDCASAIQFVRSERVNACFTGKPVHWMKRKSLIV